jgi:hypothetical protein
VKFASALCYQLMLGVGEAFVEAFMTGIGDIGM